MTKPTKEQLLEFVRNNNIDIDNQYTRNYENEWYRALAEIELLRKNQKTREEVIQQLKDENKALRLQADEYFEFWQEAIKK